MTFNEAEPDDARELSHYCKTGMILATSLHKCLR